MKKNFSENALFVGDNNDLLVSLVSNQSKEDNTHQYDFVVFDLNPPIKNIGRVGVEHGERFALKFQMQHTQDRVAVAIYVDGVNVSQREGVKPLSTITDTSNYDAHGDNILISTSPYPKKVNYLETYVGSLAQRLAFFNDNEKGVNFNTIADPEASGKIEIFCFIEKTQLPIGLDGKRSVVGAGEATYRKYETTTPLNNPIYMGKVTFIHFDAALLKHLGERIVNNPNKDFMSLVSLI